ncbi:MAG: hypothetical protein JSW08_03615 [archaeon]|nr:MAG: hypothetical protein JSW08_03615 [archaeon]
MRVRVSEEVKKEVNDLFEKAFSNEKNSSKLIKKARKIAKHVNYRIPAKFRDRFCHKCNSILRGKTRLSKGKISVECSECKQRTRKKFRTS